MTHIRVTTQIHANEFSIAVVGELASNKETDGLSTFRTLRNIVLLMAVKQ